MLSSCESPITPIGGLTDGARGKDASVLLRCVTRNPASPNEFTTLNGLRKSIMPSEAVLKLETSRRDLLVHPLYHSVRTADNLRCFMREHVFAVWDFMSLLKRLQQIVTCCEVPWLPSPEPSLARFINEIVLGEECDEDGSGGYRSHFELYLSAMDEIGADARPIRTFVRKLADRLPLETALAEAEILPSTRLFVRNTIELATKGQPHEVAAAFFYGREDIIPEMFARLVEALPTEGVSVNRLEHYLRRHIELDGDEHGPLAEKLVTRLAGNDPSKQNGATLVAIETITHRIALWDGILAEIQRAG